MESANDKRSVMFRLPIVAVCEWLMVLPATVLLAAAALRLLQPREFEPARTSWIIFEWTMRQVSGFGAAILFIAMPGVVLAAGCATILRNWRQEPALRLDSAMTLAILRRHLAFELLAAAVLLAGAILTAAVVHVITAWGPAEGDN